MEFEDLFTPVDTVRFDASVLIGQISFIDLSNQGEFLVTDEITRVLYIFAASGRHVRTIEISQCNPETVGAFLAPDFWKTVA